MSMPQVHIVAYSHDLGHGAGRGAQMLSLMLGLAIVSLVLFLPFDGFASLYVVSALFGLAQGGIVPALTCSPSVACHFPRIRPTRRSRT